MQEGVVVLVEEDGRQALHLLLEGHGREVSAIEKGRMTGLFGEELEHLRVRRIGRLHEAIEAGVSFTSLAIDIPARFDERPKFLTECRIQRFDAKNDVEVPRRSGLKAGVLKHQKRCDAANQHVA